MAKKNNTLRLIVYSISAIIAIALIHIIYVGRQEEQKSQLLLINEVKNIVSSINFDSNFSIEITPYQLSRENWVYVISDKESLAPFIVSAEKADAKPISGHSGPIYECTIIINVDDYQTKYLATVHKYERDDLYISNSFYKKVDEVSYTRGIENLIRLPGLGPWIMKIAPKGIL